MMRAGDVLVHYPYQSFTSSVERFVKQAVDDPNVLAIKMTVYRTSDDSALVPSLIEAAEKGKQAVCLVELKARFDERQNIHWSRALEEVGAHVVHGIPGLKTHAKAILIVRRERGTRPQLRDDRDRQLPRQERAAVRGLRFVHDQPRDRRRGRQPVQHADRVRPPGAASARRWSRRPGCASRSSTRSTAPSRPTGRASEARIVMKMNALVDQKMIEALYRASQAGVPIAAQRARDLLSGARHPRGQRDDRGGLGRRALPRAQPRSTRSTAATSTSTTSARPT